MKEIWDGNPEKALLVGVEMKSQNNPSDERARLSGGQASPTKTAFPFIFDGSFWTIEDSLDELESLVNTLGGSIVGRVVQRRGSVDPATYIGSGKVAEIAKRLKETGATTVVFDCNLTPAQERNLNRSFGIPVMDRTLVILEIFARRARTREAKIQVDLARMEYYLTHLVGRWSHLERQRGSIFARGGPGETQIEVDRRLTKNQIRKLKKDLQKISRDRATRRSPRQEFFQIALVGYTNSGKSTIFNALTEANIYVENRLFATLDSTVRSIKGPYNETLLLTDTVGFLRNLPHHLVASFRSTLEEIFHSDLLLEVVDAGHPKFDEHIKTTAKILENLDLAEIPRLIIFNKIDLSVPEQIERARALYPDAIFTCSLKKEDNIKLRSALLERVSATYIEDTVEIAITQQRIRSTVYELAQVVDESHHDSQTRIKFRTTPRRYQLIKSALDGERETD